MKFSIRGKLRADFGVRASRKRYYFLLVQKDLVRGGGVNFADTIDSTIAAVKDAMRGAAIPWSFAQRSEFWLRPCRK